MINALGYDFFSKYNQVPWLAHRGLGGLVIILSGIIIKI
jgi:hypothetical protein